MTNRVITILLILVTTAALVGEAARSVMETEGQWQEWLQLLVAQEVANTLDRQVQLGPIAEISLDGVEARWLAVAEDYYLRDGEMIRADRLRIAFDLRGMLRRDVAPAAGISKVRIEDGWAYVVRDAAGELNVERLLPEPVEPTPPEDSFQGTITIVRTTVIYDDYAVETVPGGPLNVELADLNAEIDMREIGWASVELSARERLGRFRTVVVRGQAELETGFAWANADVSGIDAAYWFGMFARAEGVELHRGVVDVSGSLGFLPGEPGGGEATLAGSARVRDAEVTLAALSGRRVVADATLTGTMDGVRIHSLDARIDGTTITATGFIGDWDEPVIDVAFDAMVTEPRELLDLVPEPDEQTQAQIDAVEISGPLMVTGAMIGPIKRANLSAYIEAPGQIRYASADVGEIVAGPLDLRVDILDLADVNARGRMNVVEASAVDLEPLRASLPEEMQGPIEVSPLENVTAEVLWSNEIPVVRTDLAIPRVAVGEIAVVDLRTAVALADDVIYLRDLSAEPLGGRLSADVAIDLGGEDGPWAWADGRIEGIDLARLDELPGLSSAEGLRGEFSGDFAFEYDGGTPYLIANAVVESPGYEDYGAASLRALVVVDADAVEVLGAGFEDELGVGWVRGVMPFEGEMVASFAVAGVDLERVNERFGLEVEGLGGEVFLTGSAGGTFEEPRVDARFRAFNATYEDYEIDAVTARISGGLEELEVSDLFASSGRIVARVDGSLREIDLEERDARIAGTVRLAGPVDQNALELAGLEDEDLVGAVNAEFDVAGTLRRPGAEGSVYLDFARYEAIATDDAVLRVSLRDDVLQMDELRVPVGDAVVSGNAIVTSLFDEPIISATVRASNVVLQDMAMWQEVGLPLSGTVSLPYLSVQGPLNDLTGLAQIEATELELGEQRIGRVSAAVLLDENAVTLRRTTIELAGGELSVEGRFRLDEKRILPSEVELADISISRLLHAAVPVAAWLDENGEAAGEGNGQSLARRLTALSLRLGGRLDGTVSVEGTIPEPAADGASSEETIAKMLAALHAEVNVGVRRPSFDNKPLPDTQLRAEVAGEPEVALQIEASEGDALITADGT
ncbi:MAG: hypothetical protein ACOX9R_19660, partial [Armatimonadota bacterium]